MAHALGVDQSTVSRMERTNVVSRPVEMLLDHVERRALETCVNDQTVCPDTQSVVNKFSSLHKFDADQPPHDGVDRGSTVVNRGAAPLSGREPGHVRQSHAPTLCAHTAGPSRSQDD